MQPVYVQCLIHGHSVLGKSVILTREHTMIRTNLSKLVTAERDSSHSKL